MATEVDDRDLTKSIRYATYRPSGFTGGAINESTQNLISGSGNIPVPQEPDAPAYVPQPRVDYSRPVGYGGDGDARNVSGTKGTGDIAADAGTFLRGVGGAYDTLTSHPIGMALTPFGAVYQAQKALGGVDLSSRPRAGDVSTSTTKAGPPEGFRSPGDGTMAAPPDQAASAAANVGNLGTPPDQSLGGQPDAGGRYSGTTYDQSGSTYGRSVNLSSTPSDPSSINISGIPEGAIMEGGSDNGGGASSKIICTAMCDSYGFGNFRRKVWLDWASGKDKAFERGYHAMFRPWVRFAYGKNKKQRLNSVARSVLEWGVRHRTADIWQEKRGKRDLVGAVLRSIFEPICYVVGKIKHTRRA